LDLTVAGLEIRAAPKADEAWIHSYGTIDGSFETMHIAAWLTLEHVFSVQHHRELVACDKAKKPG
jgi:hypothetical protein